MDNTREDFVNFFKRYDTDGNGELDLQELHDSIESIGWDTILTDYIWFLCDGGKTGTVSIDKFMEKYEDFAYFNVDRTKVYSAIFHKLDRDGSNSLERKEIVRFLHRIGGHWSKKAVTALIQDMDKDGDGTVDLLEFASFLDKLSSPAKQ